MLEYFFLKYFLIKELMKSKIIPISFPLILILLTVLLSSNKQVKKAETVLTNPIMFVTVQPSSDFSYQLQTFGNHLTSLNSAPRGSNLWIMYPDGTLRNLTAEAGLGLPESVVQGKGAIGVRQPSVHWTGKKALVSIILD
ncbi:MAG: hypothetical protein WBP45_12730, partial [Daejeonella sp.]